jgi:hypothetical protein
MSGSSGDEVRIRDQPVEKLLHALCAFRSMIQDPAFVGFEPWFPSVLTLFWALGRSDTEFFNRLGYSAKSRWQAPHSGRALACRGGTMLNFVLTQFSEVRGSSKVQKRFPSGLTKITSG